MDGKATKITVLSRITGFGLLWFKATVLSIGLSLWRKKKQKQIKAFWKGLERGLWQVFQK